MSLITNAWCVLLETQVGFMADDLTQWLLK
jgi:hypothetical protein